MPKLSSEQNGSYRRVAILVASLDSATADLLLAQMGDDEADRVRRAILHLGDVDPAEQEQVIEQFRSTEAPVRMPDLPGIELNDDLARKLSLPAAGSDVTAAAAFDELTDDPQPFRFLHETEFEPIMPFLRREHPQTIAIVAAHLPPDRASELLSKLPAELQVDVVRRLADLDEADPKVLKEVERGLHAWLAEHANHRQRKISGLAAVSAILDAAPSGARRQMMANLTRVDRSLAGKLQTNRHNFADLVRFDDETLVVVLRAADPELIVLALAGASEKLVERISRQLPAAQSKALGKALTHLGPTRLADVEDAQQALADLATDLETEGRIQPDLSGRSLTAAA
ncbi:MAG TPA: FliG C-terminal domain-containing protein [Pirellulales bacterium]|nr:FliG C-terminal domain-containing protein [Pirellulales bacterium]